MESKRTLSSIISVSSRGAWLLVVALLLSACYSGGPPTPTVPPGSSQDMERSEQSLEQAAQELANSEDTEGLQESEPTVTIIEHPEWGAILADARGKVLYYFAKDEPGISSCYDSCAQNWPPLLSEESPVPAAGITGTLSTIERSDGTKQVAINDLPLYYFVADQHPGEAKGQNVNEVWFVVSADGEPIREAPARDMSGTSDDLQPTASRGY